MLIISSEERNALSELAKQELRTPRDQLRVILRQVLLEHGLLPNTLITLHKQIAVPDYLGGETGPAMKNASSLSEDTT